MKKNTRNNMVHVYLNDHEKAAIEEEAKKLGISVSSYIKIKLFSKTEVK
ncbi:MAG: hypothetical protein Q7J54_04840 [Candidatus Woesearchaeota archaeon]|nr:hypothetical protein [Candidatus Woesearchaeota archaeon]